MAYAFSGPTEVVTVETSTASGALYTPTILVSVGMDRPCIDALADICNAAGIKIGSQLIAGTTKPAYKLQVSGGGSDLVMHHTFHQNGIREGDTIRLEDV